MLRPLIIASTSASVAVQLSSSCGANASNSQATCFGLSVIFSITTAELEADIAAAEAKAVKSASRAAALTDDEPAQPEGLELERDLVDRVGGLGRDDGVGRDVREEGDLLADLVAHGVIGAQDDDVGLDADPAQLDRKSVV